MNFSKTAFCKTCHISDHLEECYNKGHRINDPPYTTAEHDHFPSYNEDFEGRMN